MNKNDLRESILKERGLSTVHKEHKSRRQYKPSIKIRVDPRLKTHHMLLVEAKCGRLVEDILLNTGSFSNIVKEIAKCGVAINYTTISKWRKKLGLTFTESSLPSCQGCLEHTDICDAGVCNLLYKLQLWELITYKKSEIHKSLEVVRNLAKES